MLPVPRHRETVPPSTPTDGDLDDQLLEIFFDRMPMGIAVFDRDLRLVRCSKSWSGFFVAYLGVEESYVSPGRSIFDLIPDNEDAIAPLLEGVLAGNVVRQQAHRLQKGDIVTYWDVVFAPTFRDGEVIGFVDIVTDATERRLAYEALETRVTVLARLASAMTVDQPLEATLREAADAVVEATGAVGATLVVDPGPPGEPIEVTTGAFDPRETRRLAFPLDALGRTLGSLAAYHPPGAEVEDDLPVLQAIADLAATALENARLLSSAEQHAALLERQRLSRELHDSVSQALFSMTLHARTAQRLLDRLDLPDSGGLDGQLAKLCELSSGALAEMRALIFELRPGALAEEGLAAALTRQAQALTAREGLPIVVSAPRDRVALDPASEEHLYRIVLEALHNAVKHAHASAASVTIDPDPAAGEVVVRVEDDGVGFDPAAPRPGHLGQQTMRDRARSLGATLEVISAPGQGTRIEVRVPAPAGPAPMRPGR